MNIYQILPNLYVADLNIDETTLLQHNISNIVSINFEYNNNRFNEYKYKFDNNNKFLNSNKYNIINFELINNEIFNSLKNNQAIIIIDNDKMLSLLFCVSFITKYLNVSLFETLFCLSKKLNINLKNISKNLLFELINFSKK
jgi:hypothetical protein